MSATPRLYADFNDLAEQMGLSYFGTLRDLCITQTLLKPQLAVVLYDDADGDSTMEVDAAVEFITGAQGAMHRWRAKVAMDSFRRMPSVPKGDVYRVPCFVCRENLEMLSQKWPTDSDRCPKCSSLVLAAYLGAADV